MINKLNLSGVNDIIFNYDRAGSYCEPIYYGTIIKAGK